jgi:putative restriction endonuclease
MQPLSFYIKKFGKLNRAVVRGEKAPHKPVLLLAVIKQFDEHRISENKICITPLLVADFKDYWHKLVTGETFTPNFSLPFFHLQSDGFWHLQTKPGLHILKTSSNSIRSFGHLKEVVDYAYVESDLYALLLNEHNREVLKQTLISTYFPSHQVPGNENQLVAQIIQQILHESPAVYKTKANSFDEEEVFIRSGVFKKEIPKIYNYTCCISGMRIIAGDIQMIDACHIVPFSESHDDTITNGISLCPNLHRAFDRGLLSIDENYKVILKPFSENDNNIYSIKQFEGKDIMLPANSEYLPLQYNLEKHRQKFSFL